MIKAGIQTFLSFTLILALAACSSDRPKSKSGSGAGSGEVPIKNVPGSDDSAGDSDGNPLSLLPEEGSSLRYMDARALTKIYQNVFTKKAYGYMHCERDKPRSPADCTDSIFNRYERPAMGSFDLGTPRMDRAPANVNPVTSLTLNYTRTLRAALSRECISLVDAELVKLKANDVAANVLVKAEAPSAADLNSFMMRLLGLTGSSVKVNFEAEGYVTDFASVVTGSKDKNQGQRNAFIGVCIAISMDPLVFLY